MARTNPLQETCQERIGLIPATRATPPRMENAAYPGRKERDSVLLSFLNARTNAEAFPLVDEADAFTAMCVCHAAELAMQTGRECAVTYYCDA